MSLNALAKEIHATAVEKGWWEPERLRSFGELVALMHSELSEALEAYRILPAGTPVTIQWTDDGEKPEGVAIELADVLIRLLDTTAALGLDMDEAVRIKMKYNASRPYRHGGKTI